MTDEINLEDLVVLRQLGNYYPYMQVIKFIDKDLNENEPNLFVDVKLGIWNYSLRKLGIYREWPNIPIGEARSQQNDEIYGGIIGVYNIKNFEHIKSMVKDATIFAQEPADYFDN